MTGNSVEFNGDNGIWVFEGSGVNNGIAGNVITNNVGNGVLISTTLATISVEGNEISQNGSNGIELEQASANTIGGMTVEANIVPGNFGDDVMLQSSVGILVEGNHLSGGVNVGFESGIELAGSSIGNTIGGTTPTTGNSIVGLLGDGVAIEGTTATKNIVEGNQIIGNGLGVELIDSPDNSIGGTAGGAGNTISGNTSAGISIYASATDDQVLGNVISGNTGDGISLTGGASGIEVLGNFIGTSATGSSPLANGGSGVYLSNTTNNTIGGIGAGGRNVISGNSVSGVSLAAGATGNHVVNNFIGTDLNGLYSLPNGVGGVDLDQAMSDTIGGCAMGAGNLISGNNGNGISFEGARQASWSCAT